MFEAISANFFDLEIRALRRNPKVKSFHDISRNRNTIHHADRYTRRNPLHRHRPLEHSKWTNIEVKLLEVLPTNSPDHTQTESTDYHKMVIY